MLVTVSLLFINYSVKLKYFGRIHDTYFQRCAIFNPIHIVNKPFYCMAQSRCMVY